MKSTASTPDCYVTTLRPFQTRRERWRGRLQNLNFALFGFTTYRIRRRLGMTMAPQVHEGEIKRTPLSGSTDSGIKVREE